VLCAMPMGLIKRTTVSLFCFFLFLLPHRRQEGPSGRATSIRAHHEYRTSPVRTQPSSPPHAISHPHSPYGYASVATRHAGTRHGAHVHVHARACAVLTWYMLRRGCTVKRRREDTKVIGGPHPRVCWRVETAAADAYMPGPHLPNPCAASMRHIHTPPPPRAPHACIWVDARSFASSCSPSICTSSRVRAAHEYMPLCGLDNSAHATTVLVSLL